MAANPSDGPAARARDLLRPDWEARIKSIPPQAARRFVLDTLVKNASELCRGTGLQVPKKPPSHLS